MRRFKRLADVFFGKMESHARMQAARLKRPWNPILHLIALAIGIVLVVLLAVWMAHNP